MTGSSFLTLNGMAFRAIVCALCMKTRMACYGLELTTAVWGDSKRRFTTYRTRAGLFNNGVFQILEDHRGNLWMSSNQGIYRVRKPELNDFAEGKRNAITSIAYGKSDGMLNVECNGNRSPAGIMARDGKLWFPTQDGAAVIDPEVVRTNPQPAGDDRIVPRGSPPRGD